MSATERRILDDFDAKNLHTRVAETKCAVDKTSFHGSISFWDLGQPAMPEGALSKSPSAPPHILDKPSPKSIQALEAGRATEAEGYVLEAHRVNRRTERSVRSNRHRSVT